MAEKRGSLGKKKSKSKKKSSGKHVKEMHIRRAHSGELVAKHLHDSKPGEMSSDEEHIVPEGGMDDHIAEHMPQEQEAQGAPQPQPGGMMGAGGGGM